MVEVCQGCSWNYLTLSYVLGRGDTAPDQGQSVRE
ncbi:MAG: DUF5318 family protein [Actinoallomurus sp.]